MVDDPKEPTIDFQDWFDGGFGNEIGNLFFPTFTMRIVYTSTFFIVMSVYLGELAYANCKRICKKTPPERNTETEQLLDGNDE